jgi:hypothetical protein
LNLYGLGRDSIRKSHHDQPIADPYYIWSGLCTNNWAVTLKDENHYVDLSEYAKIIWRSKQSGFRYLHIILKLADGTWIVSDQATVNQMTGGHMNLIWKILTGTNWILQI